MTDNITQKTQMSLPDMMRHIQHLYHQKQMDKVFEYCDMVIEAKNNYPEVYYVKGTAYLSLSRFDEAIDNLTHCLALKPQYPRAMEGLVSAYRSTNQFDKAMEIGQQLIAIEPMNGLHYFQMGALLRRNGQYEQAATMQRRAIYLDNENYSYHAALAMALKDMRQYDEALQYAQNAILIKPDHTENLGLLATLFMETGKPEQAYQIYSAMLQRDPQNDSARINRVIMMFAAGKFKQGWDLFHERWLSDRLKPYYKPLEYPEWRGESLSGKTLRIYDEQGVGDGLMLASIIPYLLEMGAQVEYGCKAKTRDLLTRSLPDCVLNPENFCQTPDYACYIGDLPRNVRLFDSNDGLESLDPYLIPDISLAIQYRDDLAKMFPGKIMVGFSFYSKYKDFTQGSTKLMDWLPLWKDMNQVVLINLQYDDHSAEIEEFTAQTGIKIHNFPHVNNYSQIDNLASLVYALDFVVTAENTNGHIAGGLGRPCFLLLAQRCSWRWGWHKQQKWYGEHQFFRQTIQDSWLEPMQEARKAIEEHIMQLVEYRTNPNESLNKCDALLQKQEKKEALEVGRKLFMFFPTMVDAEFYYSSAQQLNDLTRDALRHFSILHQRIEYDPVLFGRMSLCHIERYEKQKAIEKCEQIIKRETDTNKYAWLFNNLSMQYMELGYLDKAEDILARATQHEPDNFNYIYNRSNLRVIQRRFRDAWNDYEKRIHTEKFQLFYRPYKIPEWKGEDLTGKKILIQSEQGVGEQVMFGQLIPMLDLSRAQKVAVTCKFKLEPIFKRSLQYEILKHGQGNEHIYADHFKYDYYLLMGSIPKMLDLFTTRTPPETPFLVPDTARVDDIAQKMKHLASGKKIIGISWYKRINRHNSFGIENFLPLAKRNDVILADLQYESTPDECDRLSQLSGNPVIRLSEVDSYNDIDGLVAMIKNCHEVVSIQNTTVHLAGGCGVKTHVLLPKTLDWRWSKGYDYGIWYPKFVKLYYQTQPNNWQHLIEQVNGLI